MTNPDLESFKNNKPGYVRWVDISKVGPGDIPISAPFKSLFPRLNELLLLARVLDLVIDNANCKLLSWTTRKGNICGWLCKFELWLFISVV